MVKVASVPNPFNNIANIQTSYVIDPTTTPNTKGANSVNSTGASLYISNANLSGMKKYTSKGYATCGDTIQYTIAIPNVGNVTAVNLFFIDTIPNGLSFVANSFAINGVVQPGENPVNGVTLPDVAPSETLTLTFSTTVQC